jgi:hypothetical protein
VREQDPLSIIHEVQELLSTECFLTYLVGVEHVAHLQDLILEQIKFYADPLAKVLHSEPFYHNQVVQMICMIEKGAFVAHEFYMLFAIVIHFHVCVLITEDVNWCHL